ncbi:MAG TPA: trehalose-phosphatase [Gammaproteobacteria bacterium]
MTEADRPPWPHRPALFLDLDGTLVEIVEHPDRTTASPRLRALLPALPTVTGGAVALVSGRRIEELDRILAPHTYVAAGVHGLERRDARRRLHSAGGHDRALAAARAALDAFAARHPGLWIEDKGIALAMHYRARPELERDVHRFAGELQRALPPDIEILLGRSVLELKPGVTNKGSAIAAFMEEAPFAGRTPVFVGDDVTDEAGFRTVNALGGVSVKVGAGATEARWRLAGVGAVLGWLEQLVAAGTS